MVLFLASVSEGEKPAHAMKGASANVGAKGMAEIWRKVESLGNGIPINKTTELIEQLGRGFNRVRVEIERVMRERQYEDSHAR
jgi:HPt (histidine-containing phosphotransfer) domain-containing protein